MWGQTIHAIQTCICVSVCSLSNRSPDFTRISVYGWAHIYWLQRRLICICMCHSLSIQFLWTLAMVFQIVHILSMHDVPHYIWSFERACVFPPPRLCLSTYGFLYVPAATALSKGHKPLPEMGHFLLADRLCTASLKGVCKRGSTVHKHEILISKTYVTSFKVP